MKKWIFPLTICAVFIFIAALFLTPDFTSRCTYDLIECVEAGNRSHSFWGRIWAHLGCVFSNVFCVLGGLF